MKHAEAKFTPKLNIEAALNGWPHVCFFFLSPWFITSRLEWSVCQMRKMNVIKYLSFADRRCKSILRRSQFRFHFTRRPTGGAPARAADSLRKTEAMNSEMTHYKKTCNKKFWTKPKPQIKEKKPTRHVQTQINHHSSGQLAWVASYTTDTGYKEKTKQKRFIPFSPSDKGSKICSVELGITKDTVHHLQVCSAEPAPNTFGTLGSSVDSSGNVH